MSVIVVDLERQECPYCKKMIDPRIVKHGNERRMICPRCNLNIEVIRGSKR